MKKDEEKKPTKPEGEAVASPVTPEQAFSKDPKGKDGEGTAEQQELNTDVKPSSPVSENDDLPFDPYYCIADGEETEHQDDRNSPQGTALTAVKLESSDDQDGQPEAEEHNHSEEKSDSKDAKRRKKYKKRHRSSSSYSHRDRRRKQRKKKERWVRLPSSSSERTHRGRRRR